MARNRIHLVAPAGSCSRFLDQLGVASAEPLVDLIRATVAERFVVTADTALIDAAEDEMTGGRRDDERRAADLTGALADDDVIAVASLRGGSWFTRIIPRIDFAVLDRRATRVAVTGFSELTTLVNIVSAYEQGVGVYALGPTFLTYGLKRYAAQNGLTGGDRADAAGWMRERLRTEFDRFFQNLTTMIDGRSSARTISARRVRGDIPSDTTVRLVGGNLTVFSTLIGSRYERCIDPTDRWLLLEDFNDSPPRLDRLLARLTLAGYFERCAGVLLGDFHDSERDLTPAVVDMLDYHLPADRRVPVLVTADIGHRWPVVAAPLNVAVTLIEPDDDDRVKLSWEASATRTTN